MSERRIPGDGIRLVAFADSLRGLASSLHDDIQEAMLRLLSASCLCLALSCSSEGAAPVNTDGGATQSGGGASGVASGAQVRFQYAADWKDHLGACPAISDYRLKFGGIPLLTTVSIDTDSESLGAYVALEGRGYRDSDVLHLFTCVKSQTSKSSVQVYGKFGTDLNFESAKRYTVTLSGSAASVTEDP